MRISFILNPKYWLIWLAAGILWLFVKFPYRWQMAMGRILGRVALPFSAHRRHVARTNLKLCFPQLNPNELKQLLIQCFESAGMAIFEAGIAWWMSDKRLNRLISIEGIEHIAQAKIKQQGALILTAHFTTIELAGRVLSLRTSYNATYRAHKNPVLDWIMRYCREKYIYKAIERSDVRQFIASFKANIPIWYVPDHDYGNKHSIFVPFFGVPAATITSTARIAKMTKAPVLPYFIYRHEDGKGYSAKIYPSLENYPTTDIYQDCLRVNQIIEQAILKKPDQYLWHHRRFKTRPEGESSFYN